jgi:hypothetical protein
MAVVLLMSLRLPCSHSTERHGQLGVLYQTAQTALGNTPPPPPSPNVTRSTRPMLDNTSHGPEYEAQNDLRSGLWQMKLCVFLLIFCFLFYSTTPFQVQSLYRVKWVISGWLWLSLGLHDDTIPCRNCMASRTAGKLCLWILTLTLSGRTWSWPGLRRYAIISLEGQSETVENFR